MKNEMKLNFLADPDSAAMCKGIDHSRKYISACLQRLQANM